MSAKTTSQRLHGRVVNWFEAMRRGMISANGITYRVSHHDVNYFKGQGQDLNVGDEVEFTPITPVDVQITPFAQDVQVITPYKAPSHA